MHPPIIRNPQPAPKAAPPTILISLGEFARIVNIAKPFATSDQLLPVFTGIRFFERGGHLHAEATDRYALVRVSSTVDAPAGLSVNVAAKDCAEILTRFRPQRGKSVKLRITFDGGMVVVELADGPLAIGADTTLTLRPIKGDYPKLDHLLEELATREPSAELSMFNPKYLGKLPDCGRMKVVGATRPVGFYGDDWAAAIMPMRSASDGDPSKNWAA